jgi:hypothetical protein
MKNNLVLGDYNAICDVCGFQYKASQLRRRWDGVMVCQTDFETRHPQDLIRSRRERPAPPWTRRPPADLFVVLDYVAEPSVIDDKSPLVIDGDSITIGGDDIVL